MLRKFITGRSFAVLQPVWSLSMLLLGSMLAMPALVHAHGMGLGEMARPVTTSVLVGLACYWIVVLWPASKKKDISALKMDVAASDPIRIKQKPRLRVIERRLVDD